MNKINFLSKIPGALKTDKEKIASLVDSALKKFNIDDTEIEMTFVDESTIQELNSLYRQKDTPTDILSFPQVEIKGLKPRHLGTLVMSVESIIRKDETISDVIKHGLLHLLGYDHEDENKMIEWEKAALSIGCDL